jgi:hypothetical protein
MEVSMALFSGINYFAVAVSVVFAVVLGMVWYAPKVFYDVWLKEMGINRAGMDKKRAIMAMPVMLVSVILEMLGLAIIIKMTGGGFGNAVCVGIIYGVFMTAAINLSDSFFAQQSIRSWLISGGYKVIKILAAAVLLGLWK